MVQSVHSHDEESLMRMLGIEYVPDRIVEEYIIRLNMFHRDGHNGPLGTIGLIDLVRGLGFTPPPKTWEPPVTVDWRSLAMDGSVRVDAKISGEWKHGKYLGIVGTGTVAIKLDDDEVVRECMQRDVLLVEPEDDFSDTVFDDQSKKAKLFDKPVETPEKEPVAAPEKPKPVKRATRKKRGRPKKRRGRPAKKKPSPELASPERLAAVREKLSESDAI